MNPAESSVKFSESKSDEKARLREIGLCFERVLSKGSDGKAISSLIAEGVTMLDSHIEYAIKTEVNNTLESVAKWLDFYDGKDARRSEAVRSMKTSNEALFGIVNAEGITKSLRNKS